MRWVIAQLALIATGVAFILYEAIPLPSSKWIGGFLLGIGTLNVLLHKRTGQKFFAKAQSSRPHLARFWASSGEKGTKLLFLGIGIILAVAGCVLIVLGVR
jgi:hypothetical protein